MTFKALLSTKTGDMISTALVDFNEADLMPGVVTACGLAQAMDFPGSVLPFILRNVTLAGIDSVNAPQEVRLQAWARLASDLDLDKLSRATRVIGLAEVPGLASSLLRGEVRGRTVVDVNA